MTEYTTEEAIKTIRNFRWESAELYYNRETKTFLIIMNMTDQSHVVINKPSYEVMLFLIDTQVPLITLDESRYDSRECENHEIVKYGDYTSKQLNHLKLLLL